MSRRDGLGRELTGESAWVPDSWRVRGAGRRVAVAAEDQPHLALPFDAPGVIARVPPIQDLVFTTLVDDSGLVLKLGRLGPPGGACPAAGAGTRLIHLNYPRRPTARPRGLGP